ncbi:MAG: hypothetical protein NWS53_05840 [Salibacteraceae bacterium]|nr:hypothetical protein [Salibacteraceae bacterium]
MKKLIILFFLFFCFVHGFTQDVNNLAIDATVKDKEGGRLQSAKVTLIQDGAEVNRVTTGKNGRFDLFLDFGHEYLIEIEKSGFVSKKLYINTHNVPADEQAWGYEFGGFIIDLFKDVQGIDYSILEKPIGKVYYDEVISNFQYDKAYTKEIQEEVKELEKEYESKKELAEKLEAKREEEFLLALRDAEAAIKDGDLQMAKDNLLAAQGMKPSAKEVADKLTQVNNQIAQKSNNSERYATVIKTADALFASSKYGEAIAAYNEAIAIKGTDSYAQDKVKQAEVELKTLEAKSQELSAAEKIDQEYNSMIGKADDAFSKGKYADAKSLYKNAIGIKAGEEYPKDQIIKADQKLAEEAKAEKDRLATQQLDANYQLQIEKADVAFKSGNYTNALSFYKAAQALKSAEKYPSDQIQKIGELQAEIAAKEASAEAELKVLAEYKKYISDGDNAFVSKNYEAAKKAYESALSLKENEAYPKQKIATIDERLAELKVADAKKEELAAQKKAFDDKINEAKASLDASDYQKSISLYKEAQAINPNSDIPGKQIVVIESLIAEKAKQDAQKEKAKELDVTYATYIADADSKFEAQDFSKAKTLYEQALVIKAKETYPANQISLINQTLKKIESEELAKNEKENLQRRSDDWIKKGDEAFARKELSIAEKSYNEALALIPNQEYPISQIAKINAFVAEEQAAKQEKEVVKAIDDKFMQLISKADDLFKSKLYSDARVSYEEALKIKDDTYAKAQVDKIIEEQKAVEIRSEQAALKEKLDRDYNTAIADADRLLAAKDLEKALTRYSEAASLKPGEQYPKDKIAEINFTFIAQEEEKKKQASAAIAQQKQEELDQTYKKLVSDGDRFKASDDFEVAISKYNEALSLRPTESYPQAQIDAINKLIEQRLANSKAENDKKDKYQKFLKAGDDALSNQLWDLATNSYNSALGVFSSEEYPRNQLKEVVRLKAQFEEADKKTMFDKIVGEADQFFMNKQYESAKSNYQKALSYYSEAKYPIERLNTIEKILADLDQDEREEVIDLEKKIIEEEFDEGRSKVTIRRVIVGETEDVYKRVIHSWGGRYFFLNDRPISEFVWNKETTK